MSKEQVKYNAKGMEIKKPFTFASLGVENIGPEDVMNSKHVFTYVQGEENPSAMLPLDNVYDVLVKNEEMVGNFFEVTKSGKTYDYDLNKRLRADALVKRAVSSICQNILIIYKNGFDKFVSPFIINTDKLNYIPDPSESITYQIDASDIFKIRNENNCNYYNRKFDCYDIPNGGNYEFAKINEEVITNVMECVSLVIEKISAKYDHIIRNYISNDILDIKALAKFIISADNDFDFDSLDETQYNGIVVGTLNEIACKDIDKIREIAEIELIQAGSQFFAFDRED